MKRFLSYSIFIAILISSIAFMCGNIWEKNLTIENHQAANADHTNSTPSENNSFFTILDTPCIPAGLNKVSNPRVPVTVTRALHNPCYMLKLFFSQLAHQHLSLTKYTYVSFFYSKKEYDGYYIYALRKLLI